MTETIFLDSIIFVTYNVDVIFLRESVSMQVKECYTAMQGDYEGVIGRLLNEERVKKYLFKFLNDKSFETLKAALSRADREEAFRMAHTLKGVSQNLGLTALFQSSYDLTEALRNSMSEDADVLFAKLEEDYHMTIAAISALQSE